MFLKSFFATLTNKVKAPISALSGIAIPRPIKHPLTPKEYQSKKSIERFYINKRKKKIKAAQQQPFVAAVEAEASKKIVPSKFRLTNTENNTSLRKREALPFSKLPIHPSLIDALRQSSLPPLSTPFQTEAICQLVLGQENKVLLASETGSGKTLSYLLPLLTMVKGNEDVAGNGNAKIETTSREIGSPKALILLPSNELVEQVYKIAKNFSHYIKLRISKLSASQTPQQRRRESSSGVDVLISTPRQYLLAKKKDPTKREAIKRSSPTPLLIDDDLQYLVIDEADTLLSDEDFSLTIKDIIEEKKDIFMIAVSATIPITLVKFMDSIGDSNADVSVGVDNRNRNRNHIRNHNRNLSNSMKTKIIESPNLHKVSTNVKCRFINTFLPQREKKRYLEELLVRNKEKITIIFCNKTMIAIDLYNHLTNNDNLLKVLGTIPILLHGSMMERERFDILGKFLNKDAKIMITTDLSSRGLDTLGVDHVVLYEFPRSSIEFLHRVGRTSRLGDNVNAKDNAKNYEAKNLISCFVNKKNQRLANRIELSIKNGLKLSYNEI